MPAGAATGQLAAPTSNALEVVRLRTLQSQPASRVGDGRQAENARSALTGTLGGEVGHDPGCGFYATGLRLEEVDHSAAERQPAGAHRPGVERHRPLLVNRAPATEIS